MQSRYVTPPTLVVVPAEESGCFHVYDFISKSAGTYENATIYWLSYFKEPKSWDQAVTDHPGYPYENLWIEFQTLLDDGFIHTEGDTGAARHEQYRRAWEWDITSGIFHFTVQDSEFATPAEARDIQIQKNSSEPSPELTWRCSNKALPLPFGNLPETANLLHVMMKRRTNRTSTRHPVSRSELGTCLFAGLGITGYTRTDSGNLLPLGNTPSGWARNPYEAYIFVKRSLDLAPGVYRYNADEHKLEPLPQDLPEQLSVFAGNQEWVDDMSAMVVLVAYLERTMWKYPDPNAYRVVLIEAGHIVQNTMLAAASMGLTVCPTAALAHTKLSTALGLSSITQTPIYVFTLDKAQAYPDEIVPNAKIWSGLETQALAGMA